MDRTLVAKVDNVQCFKRAVKQTGSIHLSSHHIIFKYPKPCAGALTDLPSERSSVQSIDCRQWQEVWIAFSMISQCTLRLASVGSRELSRIRIRCRDFTYYAFLFQNDVDARDVFDTIRLSTVKLRQVDQLLAFSYSRKAEAACDGWTLYNPRKEFARMGIGEKAADKGWRITTINEEFKYCPTYPALLCIPSVVSDITLKHTAGFRSKARIPVLTYYHGLNGCTITRSAQPTSGISRVRSPQDEKLVNAIFQSTKPTTKPIIGPSNTSHAYSQSIPYPGSAPQDEMDALQVPSSSLPDETGELPKIYGAQQTSLIVDARPSINAIANQAVGFGSENMEGYPTAKKKFMGIDNIHVMRKSLAEVVDALKDADFSPIAPPHSQLERSRWRKHIAKILEGSVEVASTIAIQHSHVLIHCSDGWDRTSQLSAIAQLLLDPHYRTLEGFMILVEKDWMSFGHQFRLRSGLLGHETWFEVENERAGISRTTDGNAIHEPGDGSINAFESAIARAQGFFRRRQENSSGDNDGDTLTADFSPSRTPTKQDERYITKPKEISPIFHQFLDATYQLLRQRPTRFEFNERFLRRLLYHTYSSTYGNFLFNNEKERVEAHAKERTTSVWGHFLARRQQFINELYDPVIDEKHLDRTSYMEIDPADVKWWHELFGRTEAEMPVLAADGATLETVDNASSSEHGIIDNDFGASRFGIMTSNTTLIGRNTDVTPRFPRMDLSSNLSTPSTVLNASLESSQQTETIGKM